MNLYVKAYAYIQKLLSDIIVSAFIAIAVAYLMHLISGNFHSDRVWFEKHFVILSILAVSIVVIFSNKLFPTIRTLFVIRRNQSNRRLRVLFITGVTLLLLASFFRPLTESGYSARVGYIGDLVLLFSILTYLTKIFTPKMPIIDESAFVSDTPTSNTDLTHSQKRTSNYLVEIFRAGKPRSIAITGDWGAGKTAVYLNAKNTVNTLHNDIIWVEFDPWRYASEEALVKGFYESIAQQIDRKIPGYQNAIKQIASTVDQLVSKTDKSGFYEAIASLAKNMNSASENPDVLISGLLDREGKRLVIVMDDLERQYDRERAYRALQLVHHANRMGSEYIQVVCIFEKETLLGAAPDHVSSREEYLEKFSEIEINITPPDEISLRKQLDGLIEDHKNRYLLPLDFKLDLASVNIRDIKSHRGIIRAFNELLLEFRDLAARPLLSPDGLTSNTTSSYVNYNDNFMLGHLKLKYPFIYHDISENRQLYTQSKEDERSIRVMLMDDNKIDAEIASHFEELFIKSRLDKGQTIIVREMLEELFPALSVVFGGTKSNDSQEILRKERRVGNRDVLDAYFALTQSQDAYLLYERWINELLEGIENSNDTELISKFGIFMNQAAGLQSETDGMSLLRSELTKSKHKAYALKALRAWMRAILLRTEVSVEKENSYLGRVMSAISDVIRGDPADHEQIKRSRWVFENIKEYLSDPRTALLLLLYLTPERGNNYLTLYINERAFLQGGLFQVVLKWVDEYFRTEQLNPYRAYEYTDWGFVAYQWALSIRSSGSTINDKVFGSAARYLRANKYLFKKLAEDDELAYEVINIRFWRDNLESPRSDEHGWIVDSYSMVPYDPSLLLILTNNLLVSRELNEDQLKGITEFKDALVEYMSHNKGINQ